MRERSAYGTALRIVQRAFLGFLLLAAAPAMAAEKLVLAFGDSLIAGYGVTVAQSFPVRLEAALRAAGVPARVHNGGVSGDTSAAGRARLAWTLRGLKAKPDLVIVELGANDMLRGIAPAQTRANLEAIVAALHGQRIPVLIAGMRAAPNMGKGYAARFEPIFPMLARKYGTGLYPFFLEGVITRRGLLQADGTHPNPRGVDVIVKGIAPKVVAQLR